MHTHTCPTCLRSSPTLYRSDSHSVWPRFILLLASRHALNPARGSMAARNRLQMLARRIGAPKEVMPLRGSGGPVKLAPTPDKPVRLETPRYHARCASS
jgi:hypothetical protein